MAKDISVIIKKAVENHQIRRKIFRRAKCLKKSEGKIEINCIGTSLYLIGALSEDGYVDPEKDYEIIKDSIIRIPNPVVGGIISWEQNRTSGPYPNYIKHMGVVTGVNPLKITHREWPTSSLLKDVSFEEANSHHKFSLQDILYYIIFVKNKSLLSQ